MNKKILVIDDESDDQFYHSVVKNTPYTVAIAGSSDAAIKMNQQSPFDLIFVNLSGSVNIEVDSLKQLHESQPDVPLYLITSFQKESWMNIKHLAEEGLHFEILRNSIPNSQLASVALGALEGATVL
ncbi:MAG: hypothetical protein ACE5HS_07510 [bacterium]